MIQIFIDSLVALSNWNLNPVKTDICELEPISLPRKWEDKPEVIRAANKIQREFAEVRQIAVEDIMEEEKARGPPRVSNFFDL